MLGPILGGLISAGASLFGGSQAQKSQERMAEQNIALQREFAQSGIQWRAEDARKAGIHPLAALGAQTTSFAPVSVGSPMGEGIARAGQDIGRAVNATMPSSQRAASEAHAALTLENMSLQNDLLRSQIGRMNQVSRPGIPDLAQRFMIDGQGQTAMPGVLINETPLRRQASSPEALHAEAGAVADIGYGRTASPGYAPVPSRDMQERIEDNLIGQIAWSLRNQMLPSLGWNQNPPPVPLESGNQWTYNPITQEYVQVPDIRARFRNFIRGRR